MKDRVLVDMAALAGEIMLVSGAEIYRVEESMERLFTAYGHRYFHYFSVR